MCFYNQRYLSTNNKTRQRIRPAKEVLNANQNTLDSCKFIWEMENKLNIKNIKQSIARIFIVIFINVFLIVLVVLK